MTWAAGTVPLTVPICADCSSHTVSFILGATSQLEVGEGVVWEGLEQLLSPEFQLLPERAKLGAAGRCVSQAAGVSPRLRGGSAPGGGKQRVQETKS